MLEKRGIYIPSFLFRREAPGREREGQIKREKSRNEKWRGTREGKREAESGELGEGVTRVAKGKRKASEDEKRERERD